MQAACLSIESTGLCNFNLNRCICFSAVSIRRSIFAAVSTCFCVIGISNNFPFIFLKFYRSVVCTGNSYCSNVIFRWLNSTSCIVFFVFNGSVSIIKSCTAGRADYITFYTESSRYRIFGICRSIYRCNFNSICTFFIKCTCNCFSVRTFYGIIIISRFQT